MSYIPEAASAFYRGFSLFLLIFSFGEGLFLNDWRGIALGTYVAAGMVFNSILKAITSIFFGKAGARPPGARNCGPFDARHEPDVISKSYGMPSGHSQNFSMVATLLAVAVMEKSQKSETGGDFSTVLKIGALVILTVGAMYARVDRGCHTIAQTVVGALIGLALGLFIAKNLRNPFTASKRYKGLVLKRKKSKK